MKIKTVASCLITLVDFASQRAMSVPLPYDQRVQHNNAHWLAWDTGELDLPGQQIRLHKPYPTPEPPLQNNTFDDRPKPLMPYRIPAKKPTIPRRSALPIQQRPAHHPPVHRLPTAGKQVPLPLADGAMVGTSGTMIGNHSRSNRGTPNRGLVSTLSAHCM